jgi:hypothetical protein
MMMIEWNRCRDTPRHCLGVKARSSDQDPASGLHQGQRSIAPHTKAGHMTATQNNQSQLKSILAKQEPSTHDTAQFRSGIVDAHLNLTGPARVPVNWQNNPASPAYKSP